MKEYDVIIVGAGSAGLMAAVAAGKQGERILLLDKGDKLGRKLGISGGGRCNVTNNKETDELIKNIPGNGRFLHSALSNFSNKHIIEFFEGLGIALKEEDNGRMFPVSDKAKTVVDALVGQVRRYGVELLVNSPVAGILYDEEKVLGVKLAGGKRIESKTVIVAVGGKSVPHTGSTGDGYAWAEEAGHTITPLFPTEVPLTSKEDFIAKREVQGLALRDITLSVLNEKGKPLVTHRGDMLFTHFGISGPIALRCSQFVVKQRAKTQSPVQLTIDFFPDKNVDEIYNETMHAAKLEAKKAVINVLKGYLPDRILPIVFGSTMLDPYVTYDNIPKHDWRELCQLLKAFPIKVNGTLSIEEAFVTGGGVNLKEIDPKTMQSKCKKGLYFCGEILDIHGYTGGYNITAAFSTGYTAGSHAAMTATGGE
ncbi:NAD(P)/FAD-dependent oxidoreductase [Paenibacillus montanisoli]|uniref:Aminoacetone oxidase family FAD-binding enzyme n=1 Tax=Paenibacillus montanisoli TaxID=2081970 RepID=A0A328U192_9BACL|nr:NAD(P)/FAD-dependent oxidoreductase [Paenibacillus montanisoli]RAP75221.1 aminoacetone oxidase family FAD-binding enzyme [Paenibacillus montanisoli]